MGADYDIDLVAAETRNFRIYRGDNWSAELEFLDSNNAAIDLSGCAIKMQIKAKKTDTDSVKELTIGSGLTLSGPGNNIVTIDTDGNLPARPGNYVYDFQITDLAGKVTTYLTGSMIVDQDVTR